MGEIKTGVYRGLTEQEYNAIPAIRSTMLREFMAGTPAHWRHKSQEPPPPDKKCFAEGRDLHMAVLEPDRFETRVKEMRVLPTAADLGLKNSKGEPADGFRSKEHKAIKEQLLAEIEAHNASAEYVMTSDDRDRVLRMAESLRADPDFADILSRPHETELTVVWEDIEVGLLCKARIDLWLPEERRIVEIKKTGKMATPEAFQWEIKKYGYASQCWWYIEGAKEQLGGVDDSHPVTLAVVEDSAPYLPAVRPLTKASLLTGGMEMRAALYRYANCRRTQTYPGHDNCEPFYLPGCSEGSELDLTLDGEELF